MPVDGIRFHRKVSCFRKTPETFLVPVENIIAGFEE
jgi:hypothetical protein